MCDFTMFPALVHVEGACLWTLCSRVWGREESRGREKESVEKGGVGIKEKKRKQTKEEGKTRGDEKTKQACGRRPSSV